MGSYKKEPHTPCLYGLKGGGELVKRPRPNLRLVGGKAVKNVVRLRPEKQSRLAPLLPALEESIVGLGMDYNKLITSDDYNAIRLWNGLTHLKILARDFEGEKADYLRYLYDKSLATDSGQSRPRATVIVAGWEMLADAFMFGLDEGAVGRTKEFNKKYPSPVWQEAKVGSMNILQAATNSALEVMQEINYKYGGSLMRTDARVLALDIAGSVAGLGEVTINEDSTLLITQQSFQKAWEICR